MPDRECVLCGCGAYNAHSMDFVLSFYGFLSIRTVVGHLDIPSIFPLRSTLLRILPEGSIPMTPYVAILAPWSYSSYLGSHASFLRLLMALLSQYIRRTFFASALQSFAHRLKSKFLHYYAYICSYLPSTCSSLCVAYRYLYYAI